MKNGEKLIECKNLCVEYQHVKALDNADFTVCRGDNIAVVGENGSGKSTLLSCILGLITPQSGSVEYIGISKGEIGYLPQTSSVRSDFPASVYEVVMSGTLNRDRDRKSGSLFYSSENRKTAEENLRLLGIENLRHKSFRNLSGGQRQRVLLARALCASRTMLILDEPATGLDPVVTEEFYSLISRLHQKGLTVITVSHDISYAMRFCSKILHLGTEVRFFGSAEDYRKTDLFQTLTGGKTEVKTI